jgi:cation/acetate symporter
MGWTGGYVSWRCCWHRTCASSASSRCRSSSVTASTPTRRARRGGRLPHRHLVTYVIGQMKGVGVAFSRFLEVDYDTGLYIGMAIVFFYAVLGGMKGITYTQVAQYCVLIVAYTIPAIFISLQLTGNPLPQLGLFGSTPSASRRVYLLDARPGGHRPRLQGVHATTCACRAEHGALHPVADDRHRGSAARDHPLLHGAEGGDARWSAGWALVFIACCTRRHPPWVRWRA